MNGIKIIVGDSDEKLLSSLVGQLTQGGYDVLGYDASGTGLIRKIRLYKPDVVIADVNLKGMGGFEIADVVEREGICPCVIMFKNNPAEYSLKLQEKAIYSYIQKPVNPFILDYVIENAFYNFKRINELELKLKERKVVEKAKGLLMKKYGIKENEAYDYIRRNSMDKCASMYNISLKIIKALEGKKQE